MYPAGRTLIIPEQEKSPPVKVSELSVMRFSPELLWLSERAPANEFLSVGQSHLRCAPFQSPSAFLTADESTTKYMLQALRTLTLTFADEGKSLFIHPRLMRDISINPVITEIFKACKVATKLQSSACRGAARRRLKSQVQGLISHTYKNIPDGQGLLLSLQALILAEITLCFGVLSVYSRDPMVLREDSKEVKIIGFWSWKLYSSGPWAPLPNASGAEQAWLFAESVRRTLLVGHLFGDMFDIVVTGTFNFTGFVSTLPYDLRTEFWEHPEGPPAGLVVDSLGQTKSSLQSFRQLVIRFEDGLLTPKNVSSFERMLLVACRGYRAVMAQIGSPVHH